MIIVRTRLQAVEKAPVSVIVGWGEKARKQKMSGPQRMPRKHSGVQQSAARFGGAVMSPSIYPSFIRWLKAAQPTLFRRHDSRPDPAGASRPSGPVLGKRPPSCRPA